MNAAMYQLPADHISSYLQRSGWELVNKNDRCYVFEGYEDVDNNPFVIVLPINDSAPDYPVYVEHTLRILSALAKRTPEDITEEILSYDRDILTVRVDRSVHATSIPLEVAARHISQLKQLVAYAASSDKSTKTHFSNSDSGKDMAEHFSFAHTVPGSFSFRVESSVDDEKHFQRAPQQTRMFEDDPTEVIVPRQRRVLERILRGLVDAKTAFDLGDVAPLLDGYASGFNANMCGAMVRILAKLPAPMEFRVSWSEKIPPSSDLEHLETLLIHEAYCKHLKEASRRLRKLDTKIEFIRGRVTGLSSSEPPLRDDGTERSVVVDGRLRSGTRRKVRIHLGKRDYIKAHKAHLAWSTVTVSGDLQKVGNYWQLSGPSDFKIET